MSLIRPEIRDTLLKWRDVLFGSALLAVGLFGAVNGTGLRRWTAFVLVVVGAFLLWEGIKRARFPAPGGGPGVVDVDERQITYFGPLGGGSVSLDDLIRVEIRTTDLGPLVSDLFWDFTTSDGTTLSIPGDAENASLLFDALASLPGADYEAATRAAGSTEKALFTIWDGPVRPAH